MFERRNRLGLALMTHTHLQQVERDLKTILESGGGSKGLLASLRGGKSEDSARGENSGAPFRLRDLRTARRQLNRYAYTIISSTAQTPNLSKCSTLQRASCLLHLALVLDMGKNAPPCRPMRSTKGRRRCRAAEPEKASDELEWFYAEIRFLARMGPWGNSRDVR